MREDKVTDRSRLFLVRLWQEGDDAGPAGWRGRVLHITSGKASSFQEWPELVELLTEVLSGTTASQLRQGEDRMEKEKYGGNSDVE